MTLNPILRAPTDPGTVQAEVLRDIQTRLQRLELSSGKTTSGILKSSQTLMNTPAMPIDLTTNPTGAGLNHYLVNGIHTVATGKVGDILRIYGVWRIDMDAPAFGFMGAWPQVLSPVAALTALWNVDSYYVANPDNVNMTASGTWTYVLAENGSHTVTLNGYTALSSGSFQVTGNTYLVVDHFTG